MRDANRRTFLQIVGRQPMVVRADVRLEICLGFSRQLAQEMQLAKS